MASVAQQRTAAAAERVQPRETAQLCWGVVLGARPGPPSASPSRVARRPALIAL